MADLAAAEKFQSILTDPDKQAQLSSIFPADVLEALPVLAHGAVKYVSDGGAAKELVDIVESRRRDATKSDLKAIEAIFTNTGFGINDKLIGTDYEDSTLLFAALERYSRKMLEYLLQQPSIDIVNIGDGEDRSAFEFAIVEHFPDALRLLLEYKVKDIDFKKTYRGCPPLAYAYNSTCFDILLEHPQIDVNQLIEDHPDEEVTHYNVLHATVIDKGAESVRKLLKHPKLELNGVDEQGKPVLFHIVNIQGFWFFDDRFEDGVNAFLEDPRVVLSIRDRDGKSIKDVLQEEREDLREEWFALIRPHEQDRFRRAKNQVKMMEHWNITKEDGTEIFLPDGVLSTYLLPHIADVISPLEELY